MSQQSESLIASQHRQLTGTEEAKSSPVPTQRAREMESEQLNSFHSCRVVLQQVIEAEKVQTLLQKLVAKDK